MISFDTVLNRFKENIEDLFAGLRVDRYGEIAFYPSLFRNTIMQAASNLTVLDITYDGRRRSLSLTHSFSNDAKMALAKSICTRTIKLAVVALDPELRRFYTQKFSL